jgi:branched-chain amino acid transport system ATP-binding protein
VTALLEVTDLRASYGTREVLHGLSFELQQGTITALLGTNGAGKTTTLRALCSMVDTAGEVRLEGRLISGRATEEVARCGIAHVPEGRGTFLELSVEENLKLGSYSRRDAPAAYADQERVYGYFPRLAERRRQQAGMLSGGEQQMLAIARAIMLRPRLLFLDEPSFGLSPLMVEQIFAILKGIQERERIGMLLVEQKPWLALELADRALVLETGRMVLSGTAREIRSNDSVRRSYLGY